MSGSLTLGMKMMSKKYDDHLVLNNCHVLLGVTGSIAAYKSAELVRLLKELCCDIRTVMTKGADTFITPMTLQVLSGHRVYNTLMDVEHETIMSHISLARWTNLVLVAPATAHFIAKLAAGFADDLLTTLCLATASPIMIAPAMNTVMWKNAATQENIEKLLKRNIIILNPATGSQACGDVGIGRMLEPVDIVKEVRGFFSCSQRLKGKKILVTAGPTQEAIDAVRYISNYSSGKMGYAVAEAAAREGADVILVSGITDLSCPTNVEKIDVISSEQMHASVMKHIKDCDIFISAAAVADYRPKNISEKKIKKTADSMSLELVRNTDILLSVAKLKKRPITIGFAAETDNLIENAKQKLHHKQLDMIVANWVGSGRGFQSDDNMLTVITHNKIQELPYSSKKTLANSLMRMIADYFYGPSVA